jgi:hypothetical protein
MTLVEMKIEACKRLWDIYSTSGDPIKRDAAHARWSELTADLAMVPRPPLRKYVNFAFRGKK